MESSRGIYQDSEGISFADIALRHQDGLPLASVRVRMGCRWHLFGFGRLDIPTQVSLVLSLQRKG